QRVKRARPRIVGSQHDKRRQSCRQQYQQQADAIKPDVIMNAERLDPGNVYAKLKRGIRLKLKHNPQAKRQLRECREGCEATRVLPLERHHHNRRQERPEYQKRQCHSYNTSIFKVINSSTAAAITKTYTPVFPVCTVRKPCARPRTTADVPLTIRSMSERSTTSYNARENPYSGRTISTS